MSNPIHRRRLDGGNVILTALWWRGRRAGVLAAVTALLAALVSGPGAAGTAHASTVDTSASYVLVNRGSDKAVEVDNASTADGAKAGVLAQVHTAGRVKDAGNTVQYSWPGVYFEGRVSGTGVGIVLNDSAADYDVQIDGTTVATLVTPGNTTHWISGLSNRSHTVRLVKRNDTPGDTSAFGGFVAAPGGAVLSKPAPRSRQIEFVGDSLTVGYGNLSTSRTCTADQLRRNTNSDVSYGALTARQLNADYQINGYSGLGMVRNYNGGRTDVTYRTFYDRALLSVSGDVWRNPGTWRPQVVVINLGTNDFSTAVNPGEPWTPDSLAAAYRGAYGDFIQKLRTRYGTGTTIVAVGAGQYAGHVQQVVKARNDAGDSRVRYWSLDDSGLDFLGCDWHYSAHDDRLIADRLTSFVAGLPTGW
ncbi:SGNH/GDSL hydrolase family protein [Streptomyces sviceus]|uniref:SGNH/GDSL hydrolase family protein n=1 Tax=Streptomyces sviceus TaxID=285530 RepID=UPI0036CEE50C